MLYIHKLSNLTPKTADLESIYLIRELKQKTTYPFTAEKFQAVFSDLFLSDTDREMMEHALTLIPPTIEHLEKMQQEQNEIHEAINLQRAIQLLAEIPPALRNNVDFARGIMAWQGSFVSEAVPLLNGIPKLRSREEKISCNEKVNALFQRVLRNTEFSFNHADIIHEAHVAHLIGLDESMKKGFLFHISLEEELKKVNYAAVKQRLPQERIEEAEHLERNIEVIKRGVERAYAANMRMVNWGLVMYAYVKWMMTGV